MSAAVCDEATHERLKRESQWPKLQQLGTTKLDDIELQWANCECGSTLTREVRR